MHEIRAGDNTECMLMPLVSSGFGGYNHVSSLGHRYPERYGYAERVKKEGLAQKINYGLDEHNTVTGIR